MIKINKCTIELNVNSSNYLVTFGNKLEGFFEHKGETSEGKPIHFFESDRIIFTSNELFQKFGTYQVIYN